MMSYLKLIACAIYVHVVICATTQPPNITVNMYHVLSSKIDIINLELALLRNYQMRIKQDLIQAGNEIQRIHDNQNWTALNQQLTSLKETISEISSSLAEKCQSGVVGPQSIPRPSYPVITTISFQPAFTSTPAIVYGLRVLDSSHRVNVRVAGTVMEMTNKYFTFEISEWADTEMYGSVFSWMACPKTNL